MEGSQDTAESSYTTQLHLTSFRVGSVTDVTYITFGLNSLLPTEMACILC